MTELEADLRVALLHHPLEWLHASERPNIKRDLRTHVDLILRGHLHSPEVEEIGSVHGQALHFAAGAAYQGSEWPNCAFYCRLDGDSIFVFPIRYEDQPQEIWTVHPSLFPDDSEYERAFPIPRLEPADSAPPRPAAPLPAEPPRPARTGFPSNIPSRRNRPFVGRDGLLAEIRASLDRDKAEGVLVLHGLSGTGKSELAREYARRSRSPPDNAPTLTTLREIQGRRLVEIASAVKVRPADADLAATLLAFPLQPERWEGEDAQILVHDDERLTLGGALSEIGRFDEARLWYERALEDVLPEEGRQVDHPQVGFIAHRIGLMLLSTGRNNEARAYLERAIDLSEQLSTKSRGTAMDASIARASGSASTGLGIVNRGRASTTRPGAGTREPSSTSSKGTFTDASITRASDEASTRSDSAGPRSAKTVRRCLGSSAPSKRSAGETLSVDSTTQA